MFKKIGSAALIICAYAGAHDVMLRFSSGAGDVITSQSYDQPLILTALVQRDGAEQEPTIAGLDKFAVIGRQQAIQEVTVNGAVSKLRIFQYTLLAHQPGTYELSASGYRTPIEITPSCPSRDPVTCSLRCDNHEAYVGEYVPCTITCDYEQSTITPQKLIAPTTSVLSCSVGHPETKTYSRDGVARETRTWHGTLCASASGRVLVPGVCCSYVVESRNSTFFWGWAYAQQRDGYVRTEPYVLNIRQLPPTQKQIAAIGQIDEAELVLSSRDVKQGDGVTATLNIIGTGNLDVLSDYHLTDIAGVRVYSSGSKKEELIKQVCVKYKRSYEYVLHVAKPGLITIPAQDIPFFDTQVRQYRTIHTLPVTLTVRADQTRVTTPEKSDEQTISHGVSEKLLEKSKIACVATHSDWRRKIKQLLPAFLLVALLGWLWRGYGFMRVRIYKGKKNVYKRAFKRLSSAQERNDVKDLLPLFMTLFQERTGRIGEDAFLQGEQIIQRDAVSFERWCHFKRCLLSYGGYAPYEQQDVPLSTLFELAYEWLIYLQQHDEERY